MTSTTTLARAGADVGQALSTITRRLGELATVPEAKYLRDHAETFRQFVKATKQGLAAQNQCAAVRVLAERRCGEILRTVPRVPPAERHRGRIPVGSRQVFTREIEAAGISRDQAHFWQALAKVPQEEVEALLRTISEGGEEITSARVRAAVHARQCGEQSHGGSLPPVGCRHGYEPIPDLQATEVLEPLGISPTDLDFLNERHRQVFLMEVRRAYLDTCTEAQPPRPPDRDPYSGPDVLVDVTLFRRWVREAIDRMWHGRMALVNIRRYVRVDERLKFARHPADAEKGTHTPEEGPPPSPSSPPSPVGLNHDGSPATPSAPVECHWGPVRFSHVGPYLYLVDEAGPCFLRALQSLFKPQGLLEETWTPTPDHCAKILRLVAEVRAALAEMQGKLNDREEERT